MIYGELRIQMEDSFQSQKCFLAFNIAINFDTMYAGFLANWALDSWAPWAQLSKKKGQLGPGQLSPVEEKFGSFHKQFRKFSKVPTRQVKEMSYRPTDNLRILGTNIARLSASS